MTALVPRPTLRAAHMGEAWVEGYLAIFGNPSFDRDFAQWIAPKQDWYTIRLRLCPMLDLLIHRTGIGMGQPGYRLEWQPILGAPLSWVGAQEPLSLLLGWGVRWSLCTLEFNPRGTLYLNAPLRRGIGRSRFASPYVPCLRWYARTVRFRWSPA